MHRVLGLLKQSDIVLRSIANAVSAEQVVWHRQHNTMRLFQQGNARHLASVRASIARYTAKFCQFCGSLVVLALLGHVLRGLAFRLLGFLPRR